jgi:hypothetical protein
MRFCFCFVDQLFSAVGGYRNGVEGKEDLKKVKEILSQYPSLLNEGFGTDAGYSPLMIASARNFESIVEYLLSLDGTEVNKQSIAVRFNHYIRG